MNKISTSDIKKLRDLTGAGFLDCKNALDESNSDFDKAIEFLRKKGISTAQKKSDRTASEGLIAISTNELNKEASIIELNSETDFVARNDDFQFFASNLSKINLNQKGDLDKVMESKYNNTKDKVSDALTNLISKIGEKISIRRVESFSNDKYKNFSYVHSSIKKNVGCGW